MTVERVTVSLAPELVEATRAAVASGAAESVSAFVADALRTHLTRARGLAELERVFGGPPPQAVLDTVRRDLGLQPR